VPGRQEWRQSEQESLGTLQQVSPLLLPSSPIALDGPTALCHGWMSRKVATLCSEQRHPGVVLVAGDAMDLHALLLDSMPDIVFAKDLDGRYIAGNAAWARLLGQSASTLIGQLDSDLFPQDLASDFRRNDLAMLEGGQPQRNEEWVTYPDGR